MNLSRRLFRLHAGSGLRAENKAVYQQRYPHRNRQVGDVESRPVICTDVKIEEVHNSIEAEAINNIAKHSNATEAKIIFTQSKENVFLNISDNGKGYNLNENFEGNGLKNFKKRADESFMELKIDSVIGKGTIINLIVPFF